MRCPSVSRRLDHVIKTSNMMMEKGIKSLFLPGPGLDGTGDMTDIREVQKIVLDAVKGGRPAKEMHLFAIKAL